MNSFELAVAGAGLIGRRHIDLVRANSRCRLAAIVEPAPFGRALADELDVAWFDSLEALLATRRADGVILATPNALHADQALACLRAGVPALIEKPLAHTLDEGVRLQAEANRSDVPLLVGHHRLHSPILATARRIIGEGRLGELVGVLGSAIFYKPDDYFEQAPWRAQRGGGPILINMVHEIGNLRAMCGEIASVQALASNARRGFPVEDTVSITLRFVNGALGTFLLSDTAGAARSWEHTTRENPRYPSYDDEDCYVVTGDLGSLAIPTMRLKTYATREARSWWRPFDIATVPVEHADPLVRQLDHFCDVIEGSAVPLVSVSDALQNLRIAEAIGEAAASGRIVDTPPLGVAA
ncbi:MAG TPA: Gfo/Idh/MocA family oxidoreductase [Paraburkholderia sp.]